MKVIALQDVSVLAPLAQAWLMEVNGDFGIDIDVAAHLKDLQDFVNGEQSDVLGLETESGAIAGYMGVHWFFNHMGRGKFASEHYWYVHPDHRGVGSMRLMNAAMNWAKDKGCSHFLATASELASGLHDKVCRLYEKMGMKRFETTYICEVT